MVPVQVDVERAADLLNVVVADEQVARAKAEAEPSATLVDAQTDASAGGGVFRGGGPVAGAYGAAQEGGAPAPLRRGEASGGFEAAGQVVRVERRQLPAYELDADGVRRRVVRLVPLGPPRQRRTPSCCRGRWRLGRGRARCSLPVCRTGAVSHPAAYIVVRVEDESRARGRASLGQVRGGYLSSSSSPKVTSSSAAKASASWSVWAWSMTICLSEARLRSWESRCPGGRGRGTSCRRTRSAVDRRRGQRRRGWSRAESTWRPLVLTIDETEVGRRPHPPPYPWLCSRVRAASPALVSNAASPTAHSSRFATAAQRPDRRTDRTQLGYFRGAFGDETLPCMVMKPFVFQHAQDV